MSLIKRIVSGIAVLALGFVGGLFGGIARQRAASTSTISASRLVIRDASTTAFAVIQLEDGRPILRFFEKPGVERISVGIQSGGPSIDLSRVDGSSIALSPNDDGPGFHLFNLESHGDGRGVFMSMLTANDLTIYQSGMGGVRVGRTDRGDVGVEVRDQSDRLVDRVPR